MNWWVYILRCADGSYYTGVTTDTLRRTAEHNSKNKCARYTRGRQPVQLVYAEPMANRSLACKREAEIKRLSRNQKVLLIQKTPMSDQEID